MAIYCRKPVIYVKSYIASLASLKRRHFYSEVCVGLAVQGRREAAQSGEKRREQQQQLRRVGQTRRAARGPQVGQRLLDGRVLHHRQHHVVAELLGVDRVRQVARRFPAHLQRQPATTTRGRGGGLVPQAGN